MKKPILVSTLLSLSISAFGADVVSFVNPSSLGKDIHSLNKKYQLGLKVNKDYNFYDESLIAYTNNQKSACQLLVTANKKGVVQSINISGHACQFKTTTPMTYHHLKSTTTDILNQAKLNDVAIEPGCFNCPSRLELFDSLYVNIPNQKYRVVFEIDGYKTNYHIALSKLLFKSYDEDNHYTHMDNLEEFFRDNPDAIWREDIKRLAMKYYKNTAIYGYTLSFK